MKLVNIYNKGIIPWLNIRGPIYKVQIGDHVYQLLARDHRVDIELYSEAVARKEKEAAEKLKEAAAGKQIEKIETIPEETTAQQPEPLPETTTPKIKIGPLPNPEDFPPVEDIPEDAPPVFEIIEVGEKPEPVVEPTEILVEDKIEVQEDADIEAVLDAYAEKQIDPFEVDMSNLPEKESAPDIKKYSRAELDGMTKAQMKQILIDRGHTDGPFAPRYHDSVGKLINKVIASQE